LLYLAGYGVRFWFFVQDISQLQLHYKDSWRTFFANTGTQCFFGVSDIATANLVSEMVGIATVPCSTYTNKSLTLGPYQSQFGTEQKKTLDLLCRDPTWKPVTRTLADTSRLLITPDEVMRMYDYEQIVFMKGLKPIYCYRPNYFEFSDLKEYSEMKPRK
jgi:type IV secretion system protein VirD4